MQTAAAKRALSILCLVLTVGASSRSAADERRLPLPDAATVLTLSGLNFNLINYMPRHFGGRFARPPYVLRKVRYPASLSADSIARGVAALDRALRETSGPVIVLAHSQGAQVATHWMREHANDASAPSGDRVVFLLTGNPLRAEGGYAIGRREVGGTLGEPTPVAGRWRVIDVARRYDGWADWPADSGNRRAVEAARSGMMRFHTRYDQVDLDDPTNTVWVRGTTTFVLTAEMPPLNTVPSARRATVAAEIERAYRRPPNDPRPAPQ